MTDEEIHENNEILAAFLAAVLEGGPVPHEIAAAAWGAWVAIDAAATEHLEGMKQTICDLQNELSQIHWGKLPAGGTA
ncbi:hypothetical protein [Geobacter sp. 60473]|uniref:hypothetical protein n=1 Tax=Geobacter sp. 60473 TaxID=3080755 RepID=UPI002B31C79E|nr:hypothetical protein GEO60473_09510 [Geobacter sp. 60473]